MIQLFEINEDQSITKYNSKVDNNVVRSNLERIGNQIFRLLPVREEEGEWKKPLETLILEVAGISSLFPSNSDLYILLCKLEGVRNKADEIDFLLFRRTIFELCSLANKIKDNI